MPMPSSARLPFRASLPFVLLCIFIAVLWIGGGASRSDVLGQAVVRATAALALIALALFQRRFALDRAKPVILFMAAILLLVLIQLIPLPPSIWQTLPGHATLSQAAALMGQPQPWRPLALVPGGTLNAAGSLLIPITMLCLVIGLDDDEMRWLPGLLLIMVATSTLLGLLQFSGGTFDNPLINERPNEVGGIFANRNHFALFLAAGCLLAPIWTFASEERSSWRGPAGIGLVILFILTILASGSRAGIVLGAVALAIGLLLVQRDIRRSLRRYPRWVFPAALASFVGLIAILVVVSFASDRAVSINRLLTYSVAQDDRTRALPTVTAMIRTYFPAGSGFGGFDPVFRMHEPFNLLEPTYYNHAHNDWLEVVLEGGLPGLILLLAALAWWAWKSIRAWSSKAGGDVRKARLGSAILLLVFIASVFDYPARVPTIMALIVVAAIWLNNGRKASDSAPLLPEGQHL